jgi:hypothetical protein
VSLLVGDLAAAQKERRLVTVTRPPLVSRARREHHIDEGIPQWIAAAAEHIAIVAAGVLRDPA